MIHLRYSHTEPMLSSCSLTWQPSFALYIYLYGALASPDKLMECMIHLIYSHGGHASSDLQYSPQIFIWSPCSTWYIYMEPMLHLIYSHGAYASPDIFTGAHVSSKKFDSFTRRPFIDIFTWRAMLYLTASHVGHSLIFPHGGPCFTWQLHM